MSKINNQYYVTSKFKYRRYGMDRAIYEIEGLLLNSGYLRDRLYQAYLGLREEDRRGFRQQIRGVLREYILGEKLAEAIAMSIITKEAKVSKVYSEKGELINTLDIITSIDTQTPMYSWCRKYLYRGNTKEMLIELESIIQGMTN